MFFSANADDNDLVVWIFAYAPQHGIIISHHQITRAYAVSIHKACCIGMCVCRWRTYGFGCRANNGVRLQRHREQNGRETICMRHVIRIRTFNDETE